MNIRQTYRDNLLIVSYSRFEPVMSNLEIISRSEEFHFVGKIPFFIFMRFFQFHGNRKVSRAKSWMIND